MKAAWHRLPMFFNYCQECGSALSEHAVDSEVCNFCFFGVANDDPPVGDDGLDPVAVAWYERWLR